MPPFVARVTGPQLLRFLASADEQAAAEGARYAREGRVETPSARDQGATLPDQGLSLPDQGLTLPDQGLTLLVRGDSGTYPVSFWLEASQLASTCECPSWRDPCKHQIAAVLALWPDAEPQRAGASRVAEPQRSRSAAPDLPFGLPERPDPEVARRAALEERRSAARTSSMQLHLSGEPGIVDVVSDSGFTYRVILRGGADGPHACDCPDFEANRLHSCKHVERVRLSLAADGLDLSAPHVAAADRPRAYLHFGESLEPRWFGARDAIASEPALRAAFDAVGRWLGPAGDEHAVREAFAALAEHAESHSLAWLEAHLARHPDFGGRDPAALIPPTPLPLHPYQRAGVAFLARAGRALLADEMGLGKTVQAILAAAVLRHAERPVQAVTIACPASLRGGWQDEIRRWLGEEAVLVQGSQPEREAQIASRPRWLVTHYEQVLRDHAAHRAHPPDLLIIDEAQRAKNMAAVTARALKDIGARHVFALTGTPLENRLEEAYAIAQLIDQRLLPPLWQLERDHVVREEGGRRVIAYRGLDALRTRLAPAFLRRRKEDVAFELPARVRSLLFVELHEAAAGTYESCLSQARRLAAKKRPTPQDLEKIQRLLLLCRRACDGPHLIGDFRDLRDVPKLAEIENLLRDIGLGERRKIVVFSEWTDMTSSIETISRELGLPTFSLRGEVAVGARPQLIRSFNAQEGPAVFVSTDAGGLGLNLQAADAVINVDMPWNPARLEQRLARVHRIGSRRTVQEILLVTAGTLEEGMLGLHATKRSALENLWSAEGEDVIAAPGSGDAFRSVVGELLREPPPSVASPGPPGRVPRTVDAGALARTIGEATRDLEPAQRAAVADVLRSLADALAPR
jgi:superfamily II DNA or RNA helicase